MRKLWNWFTSILGWEIILLCLMSGVSCYFLGLLTGQIMDPSEMCSRWAEWKIKADNCERDFSAYERKQEALEKLRQYSINY